MNRTSLPVRTAACSGTGRPTPTDDLIALSDRQLEAILLSGATAQPLAMLDSVSASAQLALFDAAAASPASSPASPPLPEPGTPSPRSPTSARARALKLLLDCASELQRRRLVHQMTGTRVRIDGPASLKEYLQLHFRDQEHESFVVVMADAHMRLIVVEELFRGTLTRTNVYPREIVKRVLARNAAGVFLAHNHPSGIATPSAADEHLTQTVKALLAQIDVQVHDHLIVAEGSTYSFAESGLL